MPRRIAHYSGTTGSIDSQKVKLHLAVLVVKVDFDPEGGSLRVSGTVTSEHEGLRLGARARRDRDPAHLGDERHRAHVLLRDVRRLSLLVSQEPFLVDLALVFAWKRTGLFTCTWRGDAGSPYD